MRATRQRAAISALLENLDDFRSAQELHDELRRRGEGIGLTTVYRTLQSMAAAGLVDTLRTDTGESVYRRCSDHHHHHLVCRVCGCTVEVQGGHVETWAADVAREHGFSDVSHTIEIFGVCGGCAPGLSVRVADQRLAHIGARAEHHHDQRLQRVVGQAGGREVVAQHDVRAVTAGHLLGQRHRAEHRVVRESATVSRISLSSGRSHARIWVSDTISRPSAIVTTRSDANVWSW